MKRIPRVVWLQARQLFLAVFFAVAVGLPGVVVAQSGFAPGSICHISGPKTISYADLVDDPGGWNCSDDDMDLDAERHIIRLDLTDRPSAQANPRYFEFERNAFETLSISAIGRDGSAVSQSLAQRDLQLGISSSRSIAQLPESSTPLEAVMVTVDGSDYPYAFVEASLNDRPSVVLVAGWVHIFAAMICAILFAPIIFDLIYYRVLRQPFPLYHALFCLTAVAQSATASGLTALTGLVSLQTELMIEYLSIDFMLLTIIMFANSFVKPEYIDPKHRTILRIALALAAINVGLSALDLLELSNLVFEIVYLLIALIGFGSYFYVLAVAWRRGSNTAKYLVLGLAPFASFLPLQIFSLLVFGSMVLVENVVLHSSFLLIEVIATTVAVADRFMIIRRQRDQAMDEARVLEALSERDQLTGMANRRALSARFETMVADGFDTMALIDIDFFKSINDMHGHPVGDEVLRRVASVLREGENEKDIAAFRIGGEEFLLLLRGDDAASNAEERRRAITTHLLFEMEELDNPVTASMGLVDFSALANESEIDFSSLYSRADKLLYDAKCAGRDRVVMERLSLFVPEGPTAVTA